MYTLPIKQYIAFATLIAALQACIVLPVPATKPEGMPRENISKSKIERFTPGKTTLKEVVSKLGEPDRVRFDGQTIHYKWARKNWGILWGFAGMDTGGGGLFRFGDHHMIIMEFDPHFVLQKINKSVDDGYKGHKMDVR